MKVHFAIALLCSAPLAFAWEAEVVGVIDGDTIDVRRASDGEQVRVRLAEIDAPERGQPFSAQSKQMLSGLVYRRTVEIDGDSTDRYGRTIGLIRVGSTDVQRSMLRAGMAWCYTQYAQRPSCATDQSFAQHAQHGLWSATDPAPVPPWQWRRQRPE